jgi:ribosomal protein S18 acetylase RimI-like enzyme
LQAADLTLRRKRYLQTNEMFLAYEVKLASKNEALTKPLILDFKQVYNLSPSMVSSAVEQHDYVRGDLLGFVEITQRPYGLGKVDETQTAIPRPNNGMDWAPAIKVDELQTMRPVLTNLAVSKKARKSGIGSQLLAECERHVARTWSMKELILEVEDFNIKALDFYSKRGYQVMYSDPASRRYDVNGLLLKKVPCTREIMRKSLNQVQLAREDSSKKTYDLFQRFFESVGA